jgi:hypothetical protein
MARHGRHAGVREQEAAGGVAMAIVASRRPTLHAVIRTYS